MTNWKVKLHVGGIEEYAVVDLRDTCDVYDVGKIDAGRLRMC